MNLILKILKQRKADDIFRTIFPLNCNEEEKAQDKVKKAQDNIESIVIKYCREEKSIFLARDHFGIKPLHYCICKNNFIYASEIKSILEFPEFEKKLNFKAFDNYLSFQYVPGPETLFENIYCLQPGHFMWFKNSKIKIKKFFEPVLTPDENLNLENAVDNIENAVKAYS